MPASIYITDAQLKRLAQLDCDVTVTERLEIAGPLEVWLMDKEYEPGTAHSLIIEYDGRVASDEVIEITTKDLIRGRDANDNQDKD